MHATDGMGVGFQDFLNTNLVQLTAVVRNVIFLNDSKRKILISQEVKNV